MAAHKFFDKQVECVYCQTFRQIFSLTRTNVAEYGVMAIENSVAGTILPNYGMLRDSEMHIIGEVYLHIQQNLLALTGQTIQDIREVRSHPMALQQCEAFFERHPHIELIESWDTADSARQVAEKHLKGIGAIAGLHVARMYGLKVVAEEIETNKRNFTRFLVVRNKNGTVASTVVDKASVCFIIPHVKGTLANVLTVLADHNINLTKIQSLPILGKEWEYYIHVDLEFDNYEDYTLAIASIRPMLTEFKILGEYKRGAKVQ